jgi:hypothetical protein
MDTFTFWPIDSEIEQVELFAKEVMPKVKDKVPKTKMHDL